MIGPLKAMVKVVGHELALWSGFLEAVHTGGLGALAESKAWQPCLGQSGAVSSLGMSCCALCGSSSVAEGCDTPGAAVL